MCTDILYNRLVSEGQFSSSNAADNIVILKLQIYLLCLALKIASVNIHLFIIRPYLLHNAGNSTEFRVKDSAQHLADLTDNLTIFLIRCPRAGGSEEVTTPFAPRAKSTALLYLRLRTTSVTQTVMKPIIRRKTKRSLLSLIYDASGRSARQSDLLSSGHNRQQKSGLDPSFEQRCVSVLLGSEEILRQRGGDDSAEQKWE